MGKLAGWLQEVLEGDREVFGEMLGRGRRAGSDRVGRRDTQKYRGVTREL